MTKARFGRLLIDVGMCVILYAGMVKVIDLPAFSSALATWRLVPEVLREPLVFVVPMIEITVSLLWLLNRWAMAPIGAVVLLVTFSLAYGAHAFGGPMPECGCMGRVLAMQNSMSEASIVFWRNAALILLLLVGIRLSRTRLPLAEPEGHRTPVRPEAGRAFTLIETILAVALIGVMIALVTPSLSKVRKRGQTIVSLSNLRSHAAVMSAYHADWKEAFPYFMDPRSTYSVVRNPERQFAMQAPYFAAHAMWNIALAAQYYSGDHTQKVFAPPGYPEGVADPGIAPVITAYYYPCVFQAASAFWDPATRVGPSQWVATRADQVVFPASKILFINAYPWLLSLEGAGAGEQIDMASVDGSAQIVARSRLAPQCAQGDGSYMPGTVGHTAGFPPGLHTQQGVRGRDLR